MHIYGRISVVPELPERIKRLEDLAYNLWWSWHPEVSQVFSQIDGRLWADCNENPVYFLQQADSQRLENIAHDNTYLEIYDRVMGQFDSYMNAGNTWYSQNYQGNQNDMIAYFSAEYGLHETLPIYSGGLGVLSGDHCKSASDLGLPFVAIGLFYKQGYFKQEINHEGWQEVRFQQNNVSELSVRPSKSQNNEDIIIGIDFPGRTVYAKIWQIEVGRIRIYMLDTDIPNNRHEDRQITATLYGGDQETRISQEIVLGIGGIKMLDALGIHPTVYHMNEGHSAFCVLELMRKYIQNEALTFSSAHEVVAASTVFTTHTPVPAGSDRFPLALMDKYFSNIWPMLEISRNQFMDLGIAAQQDSPDVFNMTILALKTSGQRNGVSKLHGMVSRHIFNNIWLNIPEEEVPIGSVTNGVHTETWLNPSLKKLYDRYLGRQWTDHIADAELWNKVDEIPDEELWKTHYANKENMITFLRQRLKEQSIRNGRAPEEITTLENALDPNALTIGFARRFATYKRATLIFRNLSRLYKILNNPAMPVQIIFAGKAHPADYPSHELIKQVNDLSRQEGFRGKVFIIENYDMKVAHHLISGVDIWLNNPRRPLEASGTSGQKAAINGIANFSVLDGWWVEGYNGENGWAIGDETYYSDYEQQDHVDAQLLYNTLEEKIIPLFYEKNNSGIPINWIKVMKSSIKTCTPAFSTSRMVQDYTKDLYVPAINKAHEMSENHYALPMELSRWKSEIAEQWNRVRIQPVQKGMIGAEQRMKVTQPVDLFADVYLANLKPDETRVEIFYGKVGPDGVIEQPEITTMEPEDGSNNLYHYKGTLHMESGGEYGYTFRVVPYRPELIDKHDLGLIKWADIQ